MNRILTGTLAALLLSWSGAAFAQNTTAASDSVDCSDILASPGATAEEVAAINDTSVVTVLRCQNDVPDPADAASLTSLRSAAQSNPAIASRLTAAGVAPNQVVALRRDANGQYAFYVIGAFR